MLVGERVTLANAKILAGCIATTLVSSEGRLISNVIATREAKNLASTFSREV